MDPERVIRLTILASLSVSLLDLGMAFLMRVLREAGGSDPHD